MGREKVLNTDIFKFDFVDRVDERKAIDEYLSDFSTAPGFALWLQGKRGTGKSFFLTEYVASKVGFWLLQKKINIFRKQYFFSNVVNLILQKNGHMASIVSLICIRK